MDELHKLAQSVFLSMVKENCNSEMYDKLLMYEGKWLSKNLTSHRVVQHFRRVRFEHSLEFQYCVRLTAPKLINILRLGDYLDIQVSYEIYIIYYVILKIIIMVDISSEM